MCTARKGPPRKRSQIRHQKRRSRISPLLSRGEGRESGIYSYGRAVAKIVCPSLFFCSLFSFSGEIRGQEGGGLNTLVQYAACLCWLFLFFEGGWRGIIRFRLLWWGGCFNFFIFCRYVWAFYCFGLLSGGGWVGGRVGLGILLIFLGCKCSLVHGLGGSWCSNP